MATILIVDDIAENLTVLAELLQPTYRVLATASSKRALELAASDPKPDLILLDVMMPGMDGYTVLAHLKENPATRDIPVIFVTAMDLTEDEQRGLDLGAADYITKPLRSPIVLARVHTQLELKQARDWLRDQNTLLEAEVTRRVAENELILTTADEGIYGTDADSVITFINPAAAVLLGYERKELLGQFSHAVFHHSRPDGSPYRHEDCPMFATLAAGIAIQGKEETFWRKDGTPLPIEYSSMPIVDNGKLLGAVVSFTNISERKRYLAQLERQSNYDDLTGLPNRNLLRDRLSHAIGRCQHEGGALAVLAINLDRFKEINDTLGHEAGDEVLRSAAQRLSELTQTADTLARIGGDEFVVLAYGDGGEATPAQAILKCFSAPFQIGGARFFPLRQHRHRSFPQGR